MTENVIYLWDKLRSHSYVTYWTLSSLFREQCSYGQWKIENEPLCSLSTAHWHHVCDAISFDTCFMFLIVVKLHSQDKKI